MRALIDTCVILDYLLDRKEWADISEEIFIGSSQLNFEGFITAKSLTDIYYLVHKATHSKEETKKIIMDLLEVFRLLDTQGIDCMKALTDEIDDYEDGVMIETAIRSEVDYIVTRNIEDFKNSPIPIVSPNEFVNNC